ncbi:single-stranded DNA-binding protein [Mangrovibacterium marinum]|uniref:Single-stranded DNA-binding protein n=1 Tax=Mangrovibacterium marinum TaxID=1639118 RepID=A0A2T5C4T1_9BACT|nr:single-stranded DNA-binding protein [Mangrovibacterium marinum]PTN09878.1 single-strand binding protein [Mangrovibacterium marinum]
MSVNKVILIGNVGQDPEVKHLDKDVTVARFPLATSESYTAKNGEKVTATEWHNIVVWRGLAKVVEQYVHKGDKLYLEGRIRTRSWDDKDGNKRYTTEINVDNMEMLTPKGQSTGAQQTSAPSNQQAASVSEPDFSSSDEDDLPF